jgi:GT2 family glycosyltransferase
VRLTRVVVDDGSTDNTGDVLDRVHRPGDVFLRGDGGLYWAGGMRRGLEELRRVGPFEHVLLLNDDSALQKDALKSLIRSTGGRLDRLVVGRFIDPTNGSPTYGGYRRRSGLRPLTFVPENYPPHGRIVAMNANGVLVGTDAFNRLGTLDAMFRHSLADFDYALRASAAGLDIILSDEIVGHCPRNGTAGSWRDMSATRRVRLRRMLSPKGLPPREWAAFCWRHGKLRGLPYIAAPWVSLLRSSTHPSGTRNG